MWWIKLKHKLFKWEYIAFENGLGDTIVCRIKYTPLGEPVFMYANAIYTTATKNGEFNLTRIAWITPAIKTAQTSYMKRIAK